ncbi:MAG: Uma2 family endonuclease [Planctomycetes bacterium]|nr:Uma2 family endonuclease [Planctomycetota bacterium]
MSTPLQVSLRRPIIYPESDGQPMAENTLQFEWITTIKWGLDAQYRDDPNVFVVGDLFWYPVEGDPDIRTAPDVLVVLGRPKGHRGSYQQWLEGGIAPQVIFEVLSPGNRHNEMLRKFRFYDRYGVEEYYIFDPALVALDGWLRQHGQLQEIPNVVGWTSPRLGVRFDLESDDLHIVGRDGRPFETYLQLVERAEQERQRAEQERQRAERLAAQLRALGVEPEQ